MDTPHRSQAARAQATRDSIVQAALAVFALKGYAPASMDDVALATGCSKGGLYHHFPTKVALLVAVVGRLAALDALVPPFPPVAGTAPGAIGRVLLEAWAEATREPQVRDLLRSAYESRLDATVQSGGALSDLLRIGALVQLLTRSESADIPAVARWLGIDRAA